MHRHLLADRIDQHRPPRRFRVAAAEHRLRHIDRVEHRLQQLADGHRLEVACRAATLAKLGGRRGAAVVGSAGSSAHHQVGLQRARRLDRLQDADQVARSDPQCIQAGDEVAQRHAALTGCRAGDRAGRRPRCRCAARPRSCRWRTDFGLAYHRRLGDADGQVADRC